MQTIGFIGLGNMGFRMCQNILAAGYPTIVSDVVTDACDRMAAFGAQVADCPLTLTREADIVITCLPNSDIVEAVFYGPKGIEAGLRSRSIFIDMSSSNPNRTKILAQKTADAGAKMLDAPVSGGITGAQSGTLAIMVGGEEAIYEQVFPVLQAMGDKITYMGNAGAGHLTKVINNFVSGCTLAATTEAVATAVKGGLDPERIIKVLQAGTGKSDASDRKFPRFAFRREKANFSIDLLCKDIDTYLEVARTYRIPAMISSEVFELWQIARAQGNVDIIDLVDQYERWCNVSLRP